MTPTQKVQRLEELLARIHERAAAPRAIDHAVAQAAAPATEPEPAEPLVSAASADYDEAEVEVSAEVVEVDIDVEEPLPTESGSQPVAHATMPPDDLVDEAEEAPAEEPAVATPAMEEAHAAPANELEEPAPSSSRRPIASEAPQTEAYEEESAPRHTPPPESGKQVAAPSVQPSARKSSVPPPSLEGHTLIGGWREPGIPGSGSAAGQPSPAPIKVPAPAAQASGARLSAEVTQPELPAKADVASFEGTTAKFSPVSFGDLLDASLDL